MNEKEVKAIIKKDPAAKGIKGEDLDLAIEELYESEELSVDSALMNLDEEETFDNPVAKDAFTLEVVRLKKEIKRRVRKFDDKEKLAVAHLINNVPVKTIYEKTGILLKTEDFESIKVQKLASLLSSLYLLKQGATKSQRANMLWRIALRNEERRPDLAISAVATINKMMGDSTPVKTEGGGIGAGGLTIVVQNQALANSPLDAVEVSNG